MDSSNIANFIEISIAKSNQILGHGKLIISNEINQDTSNCHLSVV